MNGAKSVLRVLHLASFVGNIGDLANHAGARRLFDLHLDYELSFTQLEIREFYWKQRSFDDDFIRYANSFDVLLIGGGNYFELWVESSATGTSIDISPQRLASLKVPTVFYSLGVDTGQGYSKSSADRFLSFLSDVLARDTMFVCVRNDGSSAALKEVVGQKIADRIPVMPDGGFFAWPGPDADKPSGSPKRLGINIAGDMLERRFSGEVSTPSFLRGLSDMCAAALDADETLTIDLVPHIWRDISLISELLPMIPDRHLRRRMTITSLAPTERGLAAFLTHYHGCDLVLGMRFHANVCPIGMHVPTIGILTYPQVEKLYVELDMQDRLWDVRKFGGDAIQSRVLQEMLVLPKTRKLYTAVAERLNVQARSVLRDMNAWLHTCFG